VDPVSGAVLPVGTQGEVRARGYQRMIGYFDLPDATAATVDGDGWVRTGDLGTMDGEGYFRITGRLKDMIIRGAENIYPREIEDLLFRHPAVTEVAVIGVPDDRWGEQVAAVLRITDLEPSPTVAELRAFCRTYLAPHKTPAFWYVTERFPLTPSGKIQKFRLLELVTAGALDGLPARTAVSA
jgi:acyl-CoA synthetase (AMP-forming)/AMP-acid ligase II